MSRAAPSGGSRKISFNVSEQYEIQDVVGEGAYGVVCSALHKPSGQKVAIKKITPFGTKQTTKHPGKNTS
jgi:mitogen-activated protein kinase 1/3